MSFIVKRFKNIKIRYKIVGILLIIIFLGIVVSGIEMYFLNQMNSRLNRIVNVSAAKVHLAAHIEHFMNQVGRLEKSIILSDDADEIDGYVASIQRGLAQVQELVTQLGELEDQQGQELLDQFNQAWLEYQILNTEIQSLARENSDRQAALMAWGIGQERFLETMQELEDLDQLLQQSLVTAEQSADLEAYQKASDKMLLTARIKQALTNVSLAEKNLILADMEENINQAYADMDAARVTLQEETARLADIVNQQEQALLDEFTAAYKEWQTIQHQIRKQALSNTTQQAIEISQETGRQAFSQAADHMTAIVNRSDQELMQDQETSNKSFILARNATIFITTLTALAALGLGGFISRIIAQGSQRIVAAANSIAYTDLANLAQAARAVADGDLTARAEIVTPSVSVQTKDELGELSTAFNQMLASLRETGRAFDQMTTNLKTLDREVTIRTHNIEEAHQRQVEINRRLQETVAQSQRRADLLQASAEVSRAAAQIHDLDQLLPRVTQLISQHFGFYHTGIFLIDEAGRFAVLRAANSPGGQRMLTRHHKLEVGATGIVGFVTDTGEPRIALDVGKDAVHFKNPDLPDTRSEMAVPLRVSDEIIGALDVQSTAEAAFSEEDVAVLTALADQLAIAIENARLFQQSQQALKEAEQAQRHYVQQQWSQFLEERTTLAHEFTLSGVASTSDIVPPAIKKAQQEGRMIIAGQANGPDQNPNDQAGNVSGAALATPIKLRGQVIGVLGLEETETERVWTEDEIELIQAVADQLGQALDNARLTEQTQASLAETQTLFETSRNLAAAQEMEDIWHAVVEAARQRRADACALFLFNTLERETASELLLAAGWDRQDPPRMPLGAHLELRNFDMFDQLRPDQHFSITDLTQAQDRDLGVKSFMNDLGFSALLHQPIAVRGRWFGLLTVLHQSPHIFTEAETNFYRTLADQAALAVEGQALLAETQRRAEREQLIRHITDRVRATPNLETILQTTVTELSKVTGLPRAFVRLGTEEELLDPTNSQT